MKKPLNIRFSYIACNSLIALKKQKQENNNTTTIHKAKVKGAHEDSKSLQLVSTGTQMQTLTNLDRVVIEDYHHMTIIGEKVK